MEELFYACWSAVIMHLWMLTLTVITHHRYICKYYTRVNEHRTIQPLSSVLVKCRQWLFKATILTDAAAAFSLINPSSTFQSVSNRSAAYSSHSSHSTSPSTNYSNKFIYYRIKSGITILNDKFHIIRELDQPTRIFSVLNLRTHFG